MANRVLVGLVETLWQCRYCVSNAFLAVSPATVTFASVPAPFSYVPHGVTLRNEDLPSGTARGDMAKSRQIQPSLAPGSQKTWTAAVCPGAAAIRWSRVIKGACNLSASATYAAS